MTDAFYFVLTVLDYRGTLPFDIVPGYKFDRADPAQLAFIRDWLGRFSLTPNTLWSSMTKRYEELMREEVADGGATQYVTCPLEPSQWRYWAISFEEAEVRGTVVDFERAIALMKQEVHIGFRAMKNLLKTHGQSDAYTSTVHHPQMLIGHWLEDPMGHFGGETIVVTEDDWREVEPIYRLLRQPSLKRPGVEIHLDKLTQLRSLPHRSDLRVIGMFSIIESLITHDPKGSEDSLSHQLRTKVPLLGKRACRPLKLSRHFGNIDETKVLTKLYDYRSRLVHGDTIDFTGAHQILGSHETVFAALLEICKVLILATLADPQLAEDLKRC